MQAILESDVVGIVIADADYKLLYFNQAAERMTGMSVTDTTPDEWPETYGSFHADKATPLAVEDQPMVRAIRGERVDRMELYLRRPGSRDGVMVSASAIPIGTRSKSAPKRSLGAVVVFREILQETSPKEGKEEANTPRRELFTDSADLQCVAGFDGYFKELSTSWERTLGFTREELKARPGIEFVHPEDRARTLDAAEKLFSGEVRRLVDFPVRYLRKDGSHVWLLWRSAVSMERRVVYGVAREINAFGYEGQRRAGQEGRVSRAATGKVERPLGLTKRQLAILRLIAAGNTDAQIAIRLGISRRTVEGHAAVIRRKLNVQSRAEAVASAYRARLLG